MEQLPIEIMEQIQELLTVSDLLQCRKINRHFYSMFYNYTLKSEQFREKILQSLHFFCWTPNADWTGVRVSSRVPGCNNGWLLPWMIGKIFFVVWKLDNVLFGSTFIKYRGRWEHWEHGLGNYAWEWVGNKKDDGSEEAPILMSEEETRFHHSSFCGMLSADNNAIQVHRRVFSYHSYKVDNLEELLNSRDRTEILDYVMQNPNNFRT
jgi:hypothetical protein